MKETLLFSSDCLLDCFFKASLNERDFRYSLLVVIFRRPLRLHICFCIYFIQKLSEHVNFGFVFIPKILDEFFKGALGCGVLLLVFCCLLFRIQEVQIRALAKMRSIKVPLTLKAAPAANFFMNEETISGFTGGRSEEVGRGIHGQFLSKLPQYF